MLDGKLNPRDIFTEDEWDVYMTKLQDLADRANTDRQFVEAFRRLAHADPVFRLWFKAYVREEGLA